MADLIAIRDIFLYILGIELALVALHGILVFGERMMELRQIEIRMKRKLKRWQDKNEL
jgi:hypothetical protein